MTEPIDEYVVQQLKEYRKRLTHEQLELLLSKPESSKRFKAMCAAMKTAYISGQDEATIAAANSIYEMVEPLSGLNFTAYFEWNKSKKDGREWFNLRSESDNAAKAISLDNVREPVTESAEQERQPKRNLTAVKR